MMEAYGEKRKLEFQEAYDVARFQAWIAAIAQRTKTLPTTPKKLLPFEWEKEKVQTVDEMKSILLGIAAASKKNKKEDK